MKSLIFQKYCFSNFCLSDSVQLHFAMQIYHTPQVKPLSSNYLQSLALQWKVRECSLDNMAFATCQLYNDLMFFSQLNSLNMMNQRSRKGMRSFSTLVKMMQFQQQNTWMRMCDFKTLFSVIQTLGVYIKMPRMLDTFMLHFPLKFYMLRLTYILFYCRSLMAGQFMQRLPNHQQVDLVLIRRAWVRLLVKTQEPTVSAITLEGIDHLQQDKTAKSKFVTFGHQGLPNIDMEVMTDRLFFSFKSLLKMVCGSQR